MFSYLGCPETALHRND